MFSRAQAMARASRSVAVTRRRRGAPGSRRARRFPSDVDRAADRGGIGRQRRRRDEVEVLAAHRREDAVVRVDARAERRDRHASAAPLVRADHAEQFAQRDHRAAGTEPPEADAVGAAPDPAGPYASAQALGQLWRAAERHGVVGVQRNEQQAQQPGPVKALFAVLPERQGEVAGRAPVALVDAAAQRTEQLACGLEVAAPEQGGAVAHQPERLVGRELLVGDDDVLRNGPAALRTPSRPVLDATLGPAHRGGQGSARRCGHGCRCRRGGWCLLLVGGWGRGAGHAGRSVTRHSAEPAPPLVRGGSRGARHAPGWNSSIPARAGSRGIRPAPRPGAGPAAGAGSKPHAVMRE